MSMRAHPDKILELSLRGKYAHFRKFYTNASSLTFTIPPRTSLAGLFASILELGRDTYYEELGSDKLWIAVSLASDSKPRKFMQTMNYMSDNSLTNPINDASQHKQCRFEILTGKGIDHVCFRIWVGYQVSNPLMSLLETKIKTQDYGFGVYLGQRQFRADLDLVREYQSDQFVFLDTSEYIDSSIASIRANPELSDTQELHIERLPMDQRREQIKKEGLRRLTRIEDVLFNVQGGRINGRFKDCYRLMNNKSEVISFL